MLRFTLIIIVTLLVTSCQLVPERMLNKKETKEMIREYYPSRKLRSICEAVNDKRHGVAKYYYEDGKLKSLAHFDMDQIHGEQISYYPNGKMRQKLNYVHDKKHGEAQGYYENGSLYVSELYADGELNGVKKKYYKNGKMMMQNLYSSGRPSADLKEYDVSGKPIMKYPGLIIEAVDRVRLNYTYTLKIYFSNKTKTGIFYITELEEGGFIPENSIPLRIENGVATYTIPVPPGSVIMKKISITGQMTTKLGNTKVVSRTYNIAVRH